LAEYIVNTSPLQYLHQVGRLALLPDLLGHVLVPPAVVSELSAGRALGIDLPDPSGLSWVRVRTPSHASGLPPSVKLGPGETEVIALTLECGDAVAVLDDRPARQAALSLDLRVTGTLGLLLDAKHAGLIPAVAPVLDELQAQRFRMAPPTRAAVLKLAGEAP
jgi:predicted nucleic acid-binding protein